MTALMHPLAASVRAEGDSGQVWVGIHGFTGTPAHLRLLARHVHEVHGHSIVVPRLAGHGTSLDDMRTTGRLHWAASVEGAVRYAFSRSDRVHLFGFSMGGLLTVSAAARFPVASLTTLNTPCLTDPRVRLARATSLVRPFRRWAQGGPEPRGEAAEYWIHYDGMPTAGIAEVGALRREALAMAADVRAPALIIHSKADETVPPASAGRLAHALHQTDVVVRYLEESPHNSLLFAERDVVASMVSAHLASVG